MSQLDIIDAVQALQEGGIPPIATAVAWVLAGGQPALAEFSSQVSLAIYNLARNGALLQVGMVPASGCWNGQVPYYHVVPR